MQSTNIQLIASFRSQKLIVVVCSKKIEGIHFLFNSNFEGDKKTTKRGFEVQEASADFRDQSRVGENDIQIKKKAKVADGKGNGSMVKANVVRHIPTKH